MKSIETKIVSKRQFVEWAVLQLGVLESPYWVPMYIHLRSYFFQHYNPNKLVSSTIHGVDFFKNLLFVMNGGAWKESEPEEIYSKNFRKLALE